jgi:hypothetical protein
VESNIEEDDDDFDDKNDVDTQQRDQMARLQRRNNQRQDQDTDDDASTSTASTVQPKRRMKDRLKSDLNHDGYWGINCHSNSEHDGTSFAMMMAEQAGVKMMQEYFELEA